MRGNGRILRLDQRKDEEGLRRFLAGEVTLSEGQRRSWVTLTRTGSFTDPRYGRFEITPKMLADMVRNFDAGTYGQDVFLDVAHEPEKGAAAKVLQLKADGNRLRAEVEWTPYGASAVLERGFRYLSAEYVEDFHDNEQGQSHGALLRGAGLTIRPVIKRLDPVVLAEPGSFSGPVLIHPGLVRLLTESLENTTMKWLENLKIKLLALGLTETTVKQLCEAAATAAKNLGEDEAALKTLAEQFEGAGKQLAEALKASPATPVQLTIGQGAVDAKTLSEAVAKALAERDDAANKQKANREARVGQFTKLLEEAKGLSEQTRKELGEQSGIIGPDWSEDQVKAFATQQIKLGEQLESARKLSALGFGAHPSGTTHITVDERNGVRKLAEQIRVNLRATAAHGDGRLRCLADEEKLPPFQAKVLAEFDRVHGHRLHEEAKLLSGGPVTISDTSLPASYQREVILEALSDLNVLQLVDADVDPTQSATHTVPYESRDVSAVRNNGIVYEGQAIHKAGVSQANAFQYIVPMKLALELTNEVIFFTRNNANINWDAYGRNVASNARYLRELVALRLLNEMQRSADAFEATAVVAESIEAQIDGANSLIKLANFPLVRPHQARDLQGTAIGSEENPITLTINDVAISMYDGSGDQAAGTYYHVENWNLGLIRLVDEAGDAVTPANTAANTISYSYATNVVLQDTDIAATLTYEQQMNKLLQKFGAQKALLSQERFIKANFGLMSETLHNLHTDAETFVASMRRDGTTTTSMGDLAAIKSVPCWATNAPGVDLGEERVILGERGTLKYRIAKPFALGAPFEVCDSSGRPLGKKAAYGEEYSSMGVPSPIRGRLTSVIAYSVTGRAAAS